MPGAARASGSTGGIVEPLLYLARYAKGVQAVEVHRLSDGALLETITADIGAIDAMAVDRRGTPFFPTLNVYDASSGALVRSVTVSSDRAAVVDTRSPGIDSFGNVYVHYSGCIAYSNRPQHCIDAINVYEPGASTPPNVIYPGKRELFGHIAYDQNGNMYGIVGLEGKNAPTEVRMYSSAARNSRVFIRGNGFYDIAIGP